MVRITLDPADPPRLTPDAADALDALTPQEVEDNARSDLDNPPMTDDELDRLGLARAVQHVRRSSGLTLGDFATRYRIDPNLLEAWERGRLRPDATVIAYLTTIRNEPEAVARALSLTTAA